MSMLVVGLSHRTASVPVLESVTVAPGELAGVLASLVRSPQVAEAMVLSTCNRVEIYAEVDRFHGGVHDVSELLARRAGTDVVSLDPHLYVHYEDAAAGHLFAVAAGLDSMVVGEAQILGQLRTAYAAAQQAGTAGRQLHDLTQQALRVGKRVHSETGIDAAGGSLVAVGLGEAQRELGDLAGRSALVCGAGSMAALTIATLHRAGLTDVVVANRTWGRAEELALAVAGRPAELAEIEDALVSVDVVVSSTAATSPVIAADAVERAMKRRDGRPLFILDLALPRDVDPAVAEIAGVNLVDLAVLRGLSAGSGAGAEVQSAREIVAAEVATFLAGRRSGEVAPTVAALRSRAAGLVEIELARLSARLPQLDGAVRIEVEAAVRRVVAALLHTPTVRVKELASTPGGDAYAAALRELFELDRPAPVVVTRAVTEEAS